MHDFKPPSKDTYDILDFYRNMTFKGPRCPAGCFNFAVVKVKNVKAM